ncbi:hypothetical protein EDB19DRAFT_1835609 [Suillus lakei]|nr:hypothetical protein EDB19DRAFT_1835609 [Suillus lakei]
MEDRRGTRYMSPESQCTFHEDVAVSTSIKGGYIVLSVENQGTKIGGLFLKKTYDADLLRMHRLANLQVREFSKKTTMVNYDGLYTNAGKEKFSVTKEDIDDSRRLVSFWVALAYIQLGSLHRLGRLGLISDSNTINFSY